MVVRKLAPVVQPQGESHDLFNNRLLCVTVTGGCVCCVLLITVQSLAMNPVADLGWLNKEGVVIFQSNVKPRLQRRH